MENVKMVEISQDLVSTSLYKIIFRFQNFEFFLQNFSISFKKNKLLFTLKAEYVRMLDTYSYT